MRFTCDGQIVEFHNLLRVRASLIQDAAHSVTIANFYDAAFICNAIIIHITSYFPENWFLIRSLASSQPET